MARRKIEDAIVVELVEWSNTEDDFEHGQDPGTEQLVLEDSNLGVFSSFAEVVDALGRFGIPAHGREGAEWHIFKDVDDSARIDIQFTVNEDNQIPTKREIEEWKRGDRTLWAAYVIVVVLTGTLEVPNAEELSRITGLETID